MDGFGFRWIKFLGLRFNSNKYGGDAKNWGGSGVGQGEGTWKVLSRVDIFKNVRGGMVMVSL